jgi:tryptophanyl-tRNA synthetase
MSGGDFRGMRILSGLQPTGRLHLGNFFGMLQPAIGLQDEGEAFYFIADYHALTSVDDPRVLRENSLNLAIDLLACGLDPAKATLFRQSEVPEVTELAWILGTFAPVETLANLQNYKERVARGALPNASLLTYPVLMAADILLYDSDLVPVGLDQLEHVEAAREIAVRFNEGRGEILRVPVARIKDRSTVVPGLDGQKMSKCNDNTLAVFEEEKLFRKAIMSLSGIAAQEDAPKNSNADHHVALVLHRLVTSPGEAAGVEEAFSRRDFGVGELKKRAFAALWEYFAPMRMRRAEYMQNTDFVHEVLSKGAEKARAIAQQTMERVRRAMGLR